MSLLFCLATSWSRISKKTDRISSCGEGEGGGERERGERGGGRGDEGRGEGEEGEGEEGEGEEGEEGEGRGRNTDSALSIYV